MNPVEVFIPIFALFGLAVVAPAWMHWLGELSSLPDHLNFLAGLILPLAVLLLGASWMDAR